MTSLKNALSGTAVGLVLAGCAATPSDTGPAVISYDHGALDTLLELGLGEKVLAVPQQGLPDYLQDFGNSRSDAGSLKVPDMQEIKALQPEMVLMTGRQGEAIEAVAELTRVKDVTLLEGAYRQSVSSMVLELAGLYDLEGLANQKLDALWQHVDERQQEVADAGSVTVVTHNDGNFSLRMEPVVYDLLELEPTTVPDSVQAISRGERTFYPVNAETLAQMAPEHLLVVDRSAAIGAEPLERSALQRQLEVAGADTQVTVLNPGLWYLSGGGLQSVRLQVDEVVDVIR